MHIGDNKLRSAPFLRRYPCYAPRSSRLYTYLPSNRRTYAMIDALPPHFIPTFSPINNSVTEIEVLKINFISKPFASILWRDDQLEAAIKLDSIITVVDAKNLRFQLKNHQDSSTFPEAFLQIAFADVVILNKVDLVSPDDLNELEKEIHSINSLANIIQSTRCQVDMSVVLNCRAYDASHAAHLEQLLEENKSLTTKDLHDSGVRTICISDSHQIDLNKVRLWLEELLWDKKHDMDLRRYEHVIQMCEQSPSSRETDTPTSSNSIPWRSTLIVKSYFYLGKLEEALEFIKKQESSGQITERLESMSLESIIPLSDTIRELLSRKEAGNESYKSGKYTEAVEHYSAALSISVESRPFAAICFCNRAAAYRTLGQISDAIADCSLAIALDPTYLKAISRRAGLYEKIRDYGQAAMDLRKLASLLTSQIEEKNLLSDKSSVVNELRQIQMRLSNIEEESRKEISLNMGVESNAEPLEVKKAYRKAALKHHPDKAALSLSRSDIGDDGLWKEIAENVCRTGIKIRSRQPKVENGPSFIIQGTAPKRIRL